jgi:hypothetical protein
MGCPSSSSSSAASSSSSGCVPHSCLGQGLNCGNINDGCGNPINCGTCGDAGVNTVCGAVIPNVCGCVPRTCAELQMGHIMTTICGKFSDLCGGMLDCGGCDGGTCSGGVCTP